MTRLHRLLIPMGLAALVGCETPPPGAEPGQAAAPRPGAVGTTTTATAAASGTPAAGDQAKGKGQARGRMEDTPVSGAKIDTKAVVDVVREEAKGGEESKGPSPANYLWHYPDEKLIKDESLAVQVPKGLQELTPNVYVPGANPLTKAKFELGKQLYFDPRVSKDGTVSCATCHNPAKGWTDRLPTSAGIDGQIGARNAPTVINTAYGKSMFWDGRALSLEGQAQGPIQNPIEMGNQNYKEIIERLRTIPAYQDQFKRVFGTEVTLDGFAKAVATFERVAALSGNSKYDQYLDRDDEGHNKKLTDGEKRGMILFGIRPNDDDEFDEAYARTNLKKANCTSCHAGFNFTDEQFHNLGVGWNASEGKFADIGRWGITPIGVKDPRDLGSFKTPTVRDITQTGPYMHDGSEQTLMDVVNFYDKGGNANPALDKDIKPLKLTDQEKKDLVAFMEALTGEPRPVDLPKLPPGADGKSPDPAPALVPPKPKTTKTALADPHGLLRIAR